MTQPLFLSAQWRHLVMINYEVDPTILLPYVPKGTELDLWNGKAYVSLVGFMFLNTNVRGFSIPFHKNFEEVNLRFYIKCDSCDGERRGVAFIKEIVPRKGIDYLARKLYNENYVALPMRHLIEEEAETIKVEYEWKFLGNWQKLGIKCKGTPQPIMQGSDVQFITEHYWGYSTLRDGETMSYQVEHPVWLVWENGEPVIDINFENLYGPSFAYYLNKKPASAFLAMGSEVTVYKGTRIS